MVKLAKYLLKILMIAVPTGALKPGALKPVTALAITTISHGQKEAYVGWRSTRYAG